MRPNLYKYYLITKSNTYYYVDTSGVVSTTTTKTPIKDSPLEWNTQSIKFGRDEQLYGVFESVSSSLSFIGDGKKILETIMYEDGGANYDAYCKVLIEKRIDDATDVWDYYTWFEGTVDFSVMVQDEDQDENYIQVRLIENSLKQLFDANRDKKYEISLIGANSKTVLMEGMDLDARYNWYSDNSTSAIFITLNGDKSFVFPMGFYSEDTKDYFRALIYPQTQGYQEVNDITGGTPGNTPDDENRFIASELDLSARVDISVDTAIQVGNYGGPVNVGLRLLRKDMTTNTNSFSTLDSTILAQNSVNNVIFTYNGTLAINASKYSYFLVISVNSGGQPAQDTTININEVDFQLEFTRSLPDTDAYAMRYKDFVSALVSEALEGEASFQSTYLNTGSASTNDLLYKYYDLIPNDVFITSGEGIRYLSDAKIKASLSDVIKDVYARYGCGIKIDDGVFRIETLDYFFDRNTEISKVYNPKKLTKRIAADWVYNTVNVGYPEFDADDLNGRNEWNSMQQYKMPVVNITEEKDMTTPFKASAYEIEYLRSYRFNSETKDDKKDNSVYLLHCNPNGNANNKYTLKKYSSPDIVTNIPNGDTQFNVAMSPSRNASRHIPEFKSVLNILDTKYSTQPRIEFIYSDRNSGLNTIIGGRQIVESGNISPAGVPTSIAQGKLFIPLILEFETIPQGGLIQQIRDTPYGYLNVIDDKYNFNCFILDLELIGSEEDSYKFTCLLAPEQDMTQFIT